MNRYSRMHLSPEVAMRNLDAIDLEEKSRIAEGIALIAVIDERRDSLAAGYSCMRSYCMGRLHMPRDKALRRIQVARAALRFPEAFECLADGRLSVTTAQCSRRIWKRRRRQRCWSGRRFAPSAKSCRCW